MLRHTIVQCLHHRSRMYACVRRTGHGRVYLDVPTFASWRAGLAGSAQRALPWLVFRPLTGYVLVPALVLFLAAVLMLGIVALVLPICAARQLGRAAGRHLRTLSWL